MTITNGEVDFERDLGMVPSSISPDKTNMLRTESPLLNAKKHGEASRMNSVQINPISLNKEKLQGNSNLLEAPASSRKQRRTVVSGGGSRIAEEDNAVISAVISTGSNAPAYTRAVDAFRKNKVETRQ